MRQRIFFNEVVTRDGFQIEPGFIATDAKVQLVDALSGCGYAKIEVTSFTSPRAIPMLRDAEEVMGRIQRVPGVEYTVLVPNQRGAERALVAVADQAGDHALVAILDDMQPKDLLAVMREFDSSKESIVNMLVTPEQFARAIVLEKKYGERTGERLRAMMNAIIHRDGTSGDITVLNSSAPAFEQAAIDAVKQWRYTPLPYEGIVTVTLKFTATR